MNINLFCFKYYYRNILFFFLSFFFDVCILLVIIRESPSSDTARNAFDGRFVIRLSSSGQFVTRLFVCAGFWNLMEELRYESCQS